MKITVTPVKVRQRHGKKQRLVADSRIKHFLLCAVIGVIPFVTTISAQTDCRTDPADCTLVSRAVMQRALEDSDTVKAQKAEIAVLNQAIDDFRKELNNMRIEYAATKGELSMCKQNGVSDRAIIDILIKNTRKKCAPLSICF